MILLYVIHQLRLEQISLLPPRSNLSKLHKRIMEVGLPSIRDYIGTVLILRLDVNFGDI